jgi:hypothetical protein
VGRECEREKEGRSSEMNDDGDLARMQELKQRTISTEKEDGNGMRRCQLGFCGRVNHCCKAGLRVWSLSLTGGEARDLDTASISLGRVANGTPLGVQV